MTENESFIKHLTIGLNNALQKGEIPSEWKTSNTTLVPKNRKPTANEFRPIALLNSTYKIFMGIIRGKLEEHLNMNKLTSDLQNGFTPHRRTTDNLCMLS